MKDPRGPIRIVTKVERRQDDGAVFLTRDCGHRSQYASHFSYKVGEEVRCFECGREMIEG